MHIICLHFELTTSAAFFDVDNTIMQGASIFHLARGLHRRKFFTTREIVGAAWKQAYFRVVGVEDPEHVAEARNSALGFIAGHTVAELEELGESGPCTAPEQRKL